MRKKYIVIKTTEKFGLWNISFPKEPKKKIKNNSIKIFNIIRPIFFLSIYWVIGLLRKCYENVVFFSHFWNFCDFEHIPSQYYIK